MKNSILCFVLAVFFASNAAEAGNFQMNERVVSRPHTIGEKAHVEKVLYSRIYRELYDACVSEGRRLKVVVGLGVEIDFQVQNFRTKTNSTGRFDENGNQEYVTAGTLYSVCWLNFF